LNSVFNDVRGRLIISVGVWEDYLSLLTVTSWYGTDEGMPTVFTDPDRWLH
jgi:hypothetical protein